MPGVTRRTLLKALLGACGAATIPWRRQEPPCEAELDLCQFQGGLWIEEPIDAEELLNELSEGLERAYLGKDWGHDTFGTVTNRLFTVTR